MITEVEKALLKQSVDLSVSNLTGQIPGMKQESDRTLTRGIVKQYMDLNDKIDKFPIDKPKTK